MRAILFWAGVVLAGASLTAAPALAQSSQDREIAQSDGQPRGERWEDRWQGRKHILYDDVWQDGTDGQATKLEQNCRVYAMRTKRPDGTTAVQRDHRCD